MNLPLPSARVNMVAGSDAVLLNWRMIFAPQGTLVVVTAEGNVAGCGEWRPGMLLNTL